MKKRPFILAGAATVALVGIVGFLARSDPLPHVIRLRLPDGAVERIHYAGKIPPQVDLSATAAPIGWTEAKPADWSLAFPLEPVDALSIAMDRQIAAFDSPLRQEPMALPQLDQAALANAPAGARTYSVISTFSGGQECTRSVEMTSAGPGKAPHVVTNALGDCNAAAAASAPQRASPSQTQT